MAKKINLKLLKELCLATGVPGNEENIRKIVKREIKDKVDSIEIDNMGNLIALKKGKSSKKKVMAAAHMDEIGFMISHIDDDGFARFQTLGGFDPKTLTAQKVTVHGKKDVIGVMGVKPIHAMKEEERKKPPKLEDYYIDFGLPAKEVNKIVSRGDFVTRFTDFTEMGNSVCTKSLDNRFAVFQLIESLKAIKKPAYDFYAVFTVQEEVGLRGAKVSAHKINPDFAFGLDVTIANHTPGIQKHDRGPKMGGGPAVMYKDRSAIADTRMVKYIEGVAKKAKVDIQPEIMDMGGTDTASMQLGADGAIAGGVFLPTRYLHTVVEMADKDDIADCIKLLTKCVEGLDKFNFKWS